MSIGEKLIDAVSKFNLSERAAWVLVLVTLVLGVVMTVALVLSYSEVRGKLVSEQIAAQVALGVDPIAASCALEGVTQRNQHVCLAAALTHRSLPRANE